MSVEPILASPPASLLRRRPRVEYLDFRNVPDYREYRLAVCGPDGPAEFRFRIAASAFGARRVLLQDGPDVCYQRLLRAVAAGETVSPEVVTIDDVELDSYREAHTRVPKHRPWSAALPAKPPFVPRRMPSPRPALPPVAVLATNDTEAVLGEGQRVSHTAFGVGVVTSSSSGHTIVCFDEDGPRTFVTSMVDLEVLSRPHTWETSPRGKNRPRKTALVGQLGTSTQDDMNLGDHRLVADLPSACAKPMMLPPGSQT
jgi:hypothetical protein